MPRRSPASLARTGWLPSQHGAWAMLLAPLIVGLILGGPHWRHVPLAVCWIVGFAAFFACGQWLRSRRKPRYVAAMVTYAAISGLAGIVVLISQPRLAWWTIAFAPLLLTSLWCSQTRRDRTILNDTVTVLAACLMTLVANDAGAHPSWAAATFAAIALFAYFEGTVFYVKTMIRERGNVTMWRFSIGYHALCACVAALASWWLAAFFVVATIRAWLLPRRGLTPKSVGLIEIAMTVALGALAVTGLITR